MFIKNHFPEVFLRELFEDLQQFGCSSNEVLLKWERIGEAREEMEFKEF